MPDIARLHDFVGGTPAVADEVDAELNQIVGTINALDDANIGAKLTEASLKPKNGVVRGTGGTTTISAAGLGWGDIAGATVTFTPAVACVAIVAASFWFDLTCDASTNAQMQGGLTVDGSVQAGAAELLNPRNGQSPLVATVGQVWGVPLGVAPHTLKLQRNYLAGPANGGRYLGTSCAFIWMLLGQ